MATGMVNRNCLPNLYCLSSRYLAFLHYTVWTILSTKAKLILFTRAVTFGKSILQDINQKESKLYVNIYVLGIHQ